MSLLKYFQVSGNNGKIWNEVSDEMREIINSGNA
jgi:hypothetical protein